MNPRTVVAASAALAAILCGLLLPQTSRAEVNARDQVNASTLLFPYFEVDLSDPGSDTVLTVRNASATAMMTNVTVWSDTGYPVLNFPVYFTGYDVVTFALRAMLVEGELPITASDGQDPTDQISPQGDYSQDINFASCNGLIPFDSPSLFPSTTQYLRDALTGQPTELVGGECLGFDHGDGTARGYITVDAMNACVAVNPTAPGYFIAGGAGLATRQNIMSGEYLVSGSGGRLVHSSTAVPIEADSQHSNWPDPPPPPVYVSGDYTFYGRYTNWTAADEREPLNGAWAVDTQARDAELIIWRDTKDPSPSPFNCALMAPAPLPLDDTARIHFATDTGASTAGGAGPFLATQRVRLGDADLGDAPGKPGWSYLNLNTSIDGTNPTAAPGANQAYVEVVHFPELPGEGGGAAAALPLDDANAPQTDLPNP